MFNAVNRFEVSGRISWIYSSRFTGETVITVELFTGSLIKGSEAKQNRIDLHVSGKLSDELKDKIKVKDRIMASGHFANCKKKIELGKGLFKESTYNKAVVEFLSIGSVKRSECHATLSGKVRFIKQMPKGNCYIIGLVTGPDEEDVIDIIYFSNNEKLMPQKGDRVLVYADLRSEEKTIQILDLKPRHEHRENLVAINLCILPPDAKTIS